MPLAMGKLSGVRHVPESGLDFVMARSRLVGAHDARPGQRQRIVVGRNGTPDFGFRKSPGDVIAVQRPCQLRRPFPIPAPGSVLAGPQRAPQIPGLDRALGVAIMHPNAGDSRAKLRVLAHFVNDLPAVLVVIIGRHDAHPLQSGLSKVRRRVLIQLESCRVSFQMPVQLMSSPCAFFAPWRNLAT